MSTKLAPALSAAGLFTQPEMPLVRVVWVAGAQPLSEYAVMESPSLPLEIGSEPAVGIAGSCPLLCSSLMTTHRPQVLGKAFDTSMVA